MNELRGKGFRRAGDYLDRLDKDQDQWTKLMRAAHECAVGLTPPPALPSDRSAMTLTVSGIADTKYTKVGQSLNVVVLIAGGTPPYNFSVTSPVHNMNFAPLPESTYSRSYGGSQELHIPLEFSGPGNYSVTFSTEDSGLPRQHVQKTKVIIVEDEGSTAQPEALSIAIEGQTEANVGEQVTLRVKGGKRGLSYIWKIRDNKSGQETAPSKPLANDTYNINASREGNFWVTVRAVKKLRSGGTSYVGNTALHSLEVKRPHKIPLHIESRDKFTVGERMDFKAVIDDPKFSLGAAPQGGYIFEWKVDNKPVSGKTYGDSISFTAKTAGRHTVAVEHKRTNPVTLQSLPLGDASKTVEIVKKQETTAQMGGCVDCLTGCRGDSMAYLSCRKACLAGICYEMCRHNCPHTSNPGGCPAECGEERDRAVKEMDKEIEKQKKPSFYYHP